MAITYLNLITKRMDDSFVRQSKGNYTRTDRDSTVTDRVVATLAANKGVPEADIVLSGYKSGVVEHSVRTTESAKKVLHTNVRSGITTYIPSVKETPLGFEATFTDITASVSVTLNIPRRALSQSAVMGDIKDHINEVLSSISTLDPNRLVRASID